MDKSKQGIVPDDIPFHDYNDIVSARHRPESGMAKSLAPDEAAEAEFVTKVKSYRFTVFLWFGGLVLVIGLAYIFWPRSISQLPPSALASIPMPIATASVTVSPPPPTTPIPTPAIADFVPPTPTVPSGGMAGLVVPAPEGVGWATSLDGRSHFGMPNIHAGLFKGQVYHGALQFDLSEVPAGSTITYAALELTGLDRQYLSPGGTWQVQLLDPTIDAAWPELTYETLHQAPIEITVGTALHSANLAQGRVNVLPFGPEQLSVLERHLANGIVSFRLDGPTSGKDNLFTWDSGYRSEEVLETRPVLRLVIIPPKAPEYVIVTSTPAPENIITAAAMAVRETEAANTIGTNTPVPENWVTPVVVVPQPTPANAATASYQQAVLTAEAILFGSATPTPSNVWTATPTLIDASTSSVPVVKQFTSSSTVVPDTTPSSTQPDYIIVTSIPTPENIITVAAMAARATQVANTIGTYTPTPHNWVTPIVVTPQPTSANTATVVYQAAVATAETFLFGPATPTPVNVWTATPTPIFVLVEGEVATPWVTMTPTATPQPIPATLVGKIAFLSNRSGGAEPLRTPLVYVIDPDGSNLAVLTDQTFYNEAIAREQYSADQRFRVFVKNAIRFDGKQVPALFFYDYSYNAEEQITHFGAGSAWDPVWSPTREQIAFVSNDTKDDEIWVVSHDGSNLRRLTATNEAYNAREIGKDTFIPELNGHPSWSPDGSQIVFWSNRTGHRQIWIMNADGSSPHSLSTTSQEDWNPVWIKYTDPARDPVPDTGGGFPNSR